MKNSKLLALSLIAFIIFLLVRRFNRVVTVVKQKMEDAKPLVLKEKTTEQFVKTNFRFWSEMFKMFFSVGSFDPYYVTHGVRTFKTPLEYGIELGKSIVPIKTKPKLNNQPKSSAPSPKLNNQPKIPAPKPKLHPEWQKVLDKFNKSLYGQ
ncbi:hypothetical protein ACLQ9O_11135 [Ornithobacterium rhinotracheale]